MIYDVVVVGGGHAGVEAAHAAAKMGVSVCLLTMHLDLIGQLSCNPAIGGIAKGIIVREIDSLGGLMGVLADGCGIHYKMLNQRKGAAVWGPRVQVDKIRYRILSRQLLEGTHHLSFFQDTVSELVALNGCVVGVKTVGGVFIRARKVIITAGTFLNGLAHIGMNSFPCGRIGEMASIHLSQSLTALGIEFGRLKTGTPARIDGNSVDLSKLTPQFGDENPMPLSFRGLYKPENTALCYMTKTNSQTHAVIRDNMDKSPLYNGKIQGIGPRYCPSIEDKIVRFGERDGHTLFLEPEGLGTSEMYLNGFSTSLPVDVQYEMLQTLPGFENVKILRPAYAIEYDYFPPTQLFQTLESKKIEGLYFAGQVNGTSGYEEAACQGLIAGINAAASVKYQEPFILTRKSSYIGVLIDDLVSKGTDEPYRMFTSRAEYRILLRQDNADRRLMPLGYAIGLLAEDQYIEAKNRWVASDKIKASLFEIKLSPEQAEELSIIIEEKTSLGELLRRPEVSIEKLSLFCTTLATITQNEQKTIEADIKYSGFIERLSHDVVSIEKMDSITLPQTINYSEITGLLTESKQKLTRIKPSTLGQAARISGVTPADITVLMVFLHTNKHK